MDQGQKNAAIAIQTVLIQQAKAERTEEVLAIIDEMMGEKDTNGNPIWTTMPATSVIAELKTRLDDSDDR